MGRARAGWGKWSPHQRAGAAKVSLKIGELRFHAQVVVTNAATAEAILGLDFLKENDCVIDIARKVLTFSKLTTSVPLSYQAIGHSDTSKTGVMLLESVCVLARSESEVMVKTQ